MASARWIRSIGNLARSFGTTAECRATAAGLQHAIEKIRELREEYWQNVRVPGSAEDLNQSLEKAGRVADFFELGELMCIDALERNESCGGHFREEYQTPEGEAQRDDEQLFVCGGVGLSRIRQRSGPGEGAAGVRLRPSQPEELQVTETGLTCELR